MSTSEARQRLAAVQETLVRALVGQGSPPEGFATARLELASRSLVNKRLRETARAWPALGRCLGEQYTERFRAFARSTPPPAEGGPLADGRAFVRTLPAELLDDKARLEVLRIDLHWRSTGGGLRPRRGPVVRLRWIGCPVLGLRLPWLGVRVVRLRAFAGAARRP
jgi:hypothetical protein